ncbi:unnamed protein product, partial [marine sediment metagenome]
SISSILKTLLSIRIGEKIIFYLYSLITICRYINIAVILYLNINT